MSKVPLYTGSIPRTLPCSWVCVEVGVREIPLHLPINLQGLRTGPPQDLSQGGPVHPEAGPSSFHPEAGPSPFHPVLIIGD